METEQQQQQDEDKVQVGDIFYTSWGYDQTNYDFIVVEDITPSGKSARCRMAQVEQVGNTAQTDTLKPIARAKGGEQFLMRIRHYKDGVKLRGSYPYSFPHDDTRLDTFWKHDGERTYAQTNSLFGH